MYGRMTVPLIHKVIRGITYHTGYCYYRNRLRAEGQNNVVFIWIPKCAGTSIYDQLRTHNCPKLKSLQAARHCFPQRGIVTFGHMDYHQLVEKGIVKESFDKTAFKFCFVRNPYERAVSLFCYMKKRGKLEEAATFLSFCELLANEGFERIGLYNVCGYSHCNPQTEWIKHLQVDFIGKVENLEVDLRLCLNKLGLSAQRPQRLNTTQHSSFPEYYCNKSKEIIERIYHIDFKHLGYQKSLVKADACVDDGMS